MAELKLVLNGKTVLEERDCTGYASFGLCTFTRVL